LILVDFINGASSSIFNIPLFTSSEPVLKNTHSELSYGYAHPVKFINSKIHAGIFRRTYFVNCTFDNIEFDFNDKDPKNYDNWRRLLVSDALFADNGNKFNNGLLLYSSWISGTDVWENGIIQNSIWNVQSYTYSYSATSSDIYTTVENKFKNGIFRQSRWVKGIFENGVFYKNNSNSVYTTSVFSDNTYGYYRYKNPSESKTRWAWLDGIFEDGIFELSNFENGLFENGQFYNSTFLDGIATGGNFGRSRLDYKSTRVGSGTFSDVIVNNANFSAENPTGQLDSYFSINWLNGVFNNGVFGVRVESASYSTEELNYRFNSYWNNGIFNNGTFQDIAIWRDGNFNNGKFISYYGYPFIITTAYPTAPSQSFAWQGGKFNNGEFGNSKTGTNSTWYDGEFNGGIFTGRYWNDGIFTKGSFIGSGTSSTSISNVANFASNFSESYYGLWNNGIVNESVDKLFKDKKIVQQAIRKVDKKTKSNTVNIKNILWRDGTFSHGDGVMSNSVWTGGSFENGQFVNSSFNPYLNYLVNGDFKLSIDSGLDYWETLNSDFDEDGVSIGTSLSQDDDGIFAKKLKFSGTSSLTKIYQTTGLSIGESYTLRIILNSNNNTEITYGSWAGILRNGNFSEGSSYWLFGVTESNQLTPPTLTIATGSPGYIQYDSSTDGGRAYIIYPNVLEVGKNYELSFFTFNNTPNSNHPYTVGSCDSSQIDIVDDYIISTDFIDGINASFSNSAIPNAGSNKIVENFTSAFTDLLIVIDTTISAESLSISGINLRSTRVLFTSNATQSRTLESSFTADGGDFAIEFLPIATGNVSDSINSIQTYATSSTDIKSIELIRGDSGFNLSDSCVWYNGRFINSEFYISKWYNGRWISGTATGMIWKNGVANYMNAYNVYWEGGVWRNGNWNGSPFGLENITEDGCVYNYGSSQGATVSSKTTNYIGVIVDGYGFGASGGFSYSVPGTGLQPEIDPDNDTLGNPSVYTDGYFYTYTSNTFTSGKRYKITITLGTFSVADASYKGRPSIYFSLGRPYAANTIYGDVFGSLYPSNSNIATGASNISKRYQIDELDAHTGSVIPDFYTPGTDGYQSTSAGTITEILDCIDPSNSKLYLHFDLYGSIDLYIDEILVEEEICTQTGVINSGYASDILTNIARYRLEGGTSSSDYRALFLNNAFTFTSSSSWSKVIGSPDLTQYSFTYSSASVLKWNYSESYSPYNYCPNGIIINGRQLNSWGKVGLENDTNFYNDRTSSVKLYAVNTDNSLDIFSQSGEYQIKLKYWCSYDGPWGGVSTGSSATKTVKFNINIAYQQNITENGGYQQTIVENINVLPVGCSTNIPSNSSNSGFSVNSFSPNVQFAHGQTNVKTLEFTFSPIAFAEYSTETADTFRLSIQKIGSSSGTKLHILYLGVENTNYEYNSVYNNENCPDIFSTDPQFGETLPLPSTISYRGGSSNGTPISIRYGNGAFTSGLADSYSSIWENGVWNEGLRYDKYVVYFENFVSFSGTSKPMSYPAVYVRRPVKSGQVANIYDNNISSLKPSSNTYTIALYTSQYKYIFEDGFEVDQNPSPEDRLEGIKTIRNSFKIGDKVAVGNISALDANGIRRLIKDYWTVVDIISPEVSDGSQGSNDLMYLQITLNFSARIIQKDSENHPIYVSKNIWLSGGFLNGKFRGVWNNGLFKGRPYITRMVDSQWIDGRFDGGRFRGKTVDYLVPGDGKDDNEFATFSTNSGLIQNFRFNDNNIGSANSTTLKNYLKYNSWIDVNYFESSMTNIYRKGSSWDDILETNKSLLNLNGYPTKDVLSSLSIFKNTFDNDRRAYSLGWKYKIYDDYIENPFFDYPINSNQSFLTGLYESDVDGLTESFEVGATYSVPGLYRFTKNNKWRTSILTPTLLSSGVSFAPFLSANTSVDNIDLLKIVSVTQSSRPFLLENDTTKLRADSKPFRYTVIEFEMNHKPINNGFKYPYLLNEPQTKLFTGDDLVSYISTVPDIIGHNQTSEVIKREYFWNKPSLQMVMAQTLHFYDVIFENGYNLAFTGSNPGLTAGDIIYVSKRDVTQNSQINRFFTVIDFRYSLTWGYLAQVNIPSYDSTTTGTDGGIVFLLKPYTNEFKYIKMYEVDSIPFFYYAGEDRINQKVQVPLGSIAPPIDYSDSNFSLIDSLIISETAFDAISVPSVVITPSGFSSRPGRLDILNADVQRADSSFGVGLVTGGSSPFNPGQSVFNECRGSSSGNSGNSN